MKRHVAAAVVLLLVGSTLAQARLVKEMEITTACKIDLKTEDQTSWYEIVTQNNKHYVLGDREFFGPATRQALDEAAKRELSAEITGHLLIYNDQEPIFALPLRKIDIKGLNLQVAAQEPNQPASAASGDAAAFKTARLKSNKTTTLDHALNDYAFFTNRGWKVLTPGQEAEFRGELNLMDYSDKDTKMIERLKSRNLADTFRSITFVAPVTLSGPGVADSPDPYVEAVLQDGTRDRLVWKEPAGYYWDRIFKQRKIKIDYFISKAAQNPNYGKGPEGGVQ
jgi:hypothetical protein